MKVVMFGCVKFWIWNNKSSSNVNDSSNKSWSEFYKRWLSVSCSVRKCLVLLCLCRYDFILLRNTCKLTENRFYVKYRLVWKSNILPLNPLKKGITLLYGWIYEHMFIYMNICFACSNIQPYTMLVVSMKHFFKISLQNY